MTPVSSFSRLRMPGRLLLLGMTAALGVVLLPRVFAHGGEDHGGGAAGPAGGGDTVTVAQDAQFALGLRTAIADTQAVSETILLAGELAAGSGGEAIVASPQSGRLLGARLPGVGTAVRAGQSFGTVEGALAAPDVADLRVARAGIEAEIAQARADVTRLRALARVVPAKEIEAAEIRLRGAQAQLAALGGALGAGNRYAIVAPISGIVAEVMTAPGTFVEAGVPLLRIVSLSRLQVRARVPEADLGRVRSAARAARVTTDAYPGMTFEATLVSFGAVVDPQSRTVDAIFAIANPNGLLKLGQTVAVELPLGAGRFAVTIPRSALVRDEAGAPTVFLHPTAEDFVRHRVTLGPEIGDRVSVSTGLVAGDRVVVEGAYSLRPQ